MNAAPSANARDAGFSLLEVLLALWIIGLLALPAGQAVVLSLRAEEAGRAQREAALLLTSLQTAVWLAGDEGDAGWEAPEGWTRRDDLENVEQPSGTTVWRITTLAHPERGFSARTAFLVETVQE
jgi:prepilin-type N-terminal cleavage/methylation domain-containing protein